MMDIEEQLLGHIMQGLELDPHSALHTLQQKQAVRERGSTRQRRDKRRPRSAHLCKAHNESCPQIIHELQLSFAANGKLPCCVNVRRGVVDLGASANLPKQTCGRHRMKKKMKGPKLHSRRAETKESYSVHNSLKKPVKPIVFQEDQEETFQRNRWRPSDLKTKRPSSARRFHGKPEEGKTNKSWYVSGNPAACKLGRTVCKTIRLTTSEKKVELAEFKTRSNQCESQLFDNAVSDVIEDEDEDEDDHNDDNDQMYRDLLKATKERVAPREDKIFTLDVDIGQRDRCVSLKAKRPQSAKRWSETHKHDVRYGLDLSQPDTSTCPSRKQHMRSSNMRETLRPHSASSRARHMSQTSFTAAAAAVVQQKNFQFTQERPHAEKTSAPPQNVRHKNFVPKLKLRQFPYRKADNVAAFLSLSPEERARLVRNIKYE